MMEFFSSRAAAVMLNATLFMFFVGLDATGHSSKLVEIFAPQFGGALLMALSSRDGKSKADPPPPADEVAK